MYDERKRFLIKKIFVNADRKQSDIGGGMVAAGT